jgi:hypothetical protein
MTQSLENQAFSSNPLRRSAEPTSTGRVSPAPSSAVPTNPVLTNPVLANPVLASTGPASAAPAVSTQPAGTQPARIGHPRGLVHYPAELSMKDAVGQYFAANGFGPDGGYSSPWVDFKLGSLSFPLRNTQARKAAVPYHDLHHVLTGYRTDVVGEMEISAWELAAGCKNYFAAWQLNLGGLFIGVCHSPRRVWHAWQRGRRSESLYGRDYPALIEQTVGALRPTVLDARPARGEGAATALSFAAHVLGGLTLSLAALPLAVVAAPIGLLYLQRKGRKGAEQRATPQPK